MRSEPYTVRLLGGAATSAVPSAESSAPLCLPFELTNGQWTPDVCSHDKAWQSFSWCRVPPFRAGRTRDALRRHRSSLVFSGNSVMRHIYLRLVAMLNGTTEVRSRAWAAAGGCGVMTSPTPV